MARDVDRGMLTFALVFLLLPAVLFVLAAVVTSYALLFVLLGLLVLVIGFTIGVGVLGV